MYQFKSADGNNIEIVLQGALTRNEFRRMVEQIESLPSHNVDVNIIFDTRELRDHYTFKVFLDEFGFSKRYGSPVNHVAFVSDRESEVFLLEQFISNVEPVFKTFNQMKSARKWMVH
jgi:hypothetical protein